MPLIYDTPLTQIRHLCTILTFLMHVSDVSGYEWGHDAAAVTDSVAYSYVIILPDPELLAPSDGVMNYLDFYSVDAGVKFRMVVLRSAGTTANSTRRYGVQAITTYILASRRGRQTTELRSEDIRVQKDDVISFWIYEKMPIPYGIKSTCSRGRSVLVSEAGVTNLTRGEMFEFRPIMPEKCWEFSYRIDVLSPAVELLADVSRSDVTERASYVNGSMNDVIMIDSSVPCRADCDVAAISDQRLTNMHRYVIFGPLIVLWIIVSAICSVKIKRTLPCCRKSARSAVTPSGQAPRRAPPRRGRLCRVSLSREPPVGATIACSPPKPASNSALPPFVLPAYPGLPSADPDDRPACVFPPYPPPPAYSARDDKNDPLATAFGYVGHLASVEEVNVPNADDVSGLRTAAPRPAGDADGMDERVSGPSPEASMMTSRPGQIAWNGCYEAYLGPPPPYEAALETHM